MTSAHTWGQTAVAIAVCAVAAAALVARAPEEYPKPRYPKYLVKPSMERLLQAARIAVRQPYGRAPLGKIQSGQTVHVFVEYSQDPQVFEAIRRAWAERGVQAISIGGWELAGLPKDEYLRRAKANLLHGYEGWKELGVFEPAYLPFFPPAVRKEFGEPLTFFVTVKNLRGYLDAHPEIRLFFQGVGGRGFVVQAAGPAHEKKFVGNWIYETPVELLGKASEFPGDVWALVDDRIVKPIAHVSEGTFTDPEGTRLHWQLTPDQTRLWAESTGDPNHLTIYPKPSRATWKDGVIVASGNHTGYFPTMRVHLNEHGRVVKVEGGGKAGDLFRMLVGHPKLAGARFPSGPEPGYWYLSQDGFATNPKSVRDVQYMIDGSQNFTNLSERNRAGVQHFSFSHPGSAFNTDPRDAEYARSQGLPLGHTAHMHVYFPTLKWKLSDTGEWITIADKGRIAAFDDPELRALASKYGDPDLVFRYEWIPSMPGINVPGNPGDYARDPWKWIMSEWARIQSGTFEYYVDDYSSTGAAKPSRH